MLDVAASSYTPTLRALLEARRETSAAEHGAGGPVPDRRLLIVAVPQALGAVPLTEIERERRHLVALFPHDHTLLLGADALRGNVMERLSQHRWAHFSCHGTQNLPDPSSGGIVCSDGILTIADISSGQYRNDFAFLSACKTATGGSSLPDEAITLAATMHYTGYRHVIATLLSVLDTAAADIAVSVYAYLMSSGTFTPADSAHALHHAITNRRTHAAWPTSWWSPFTHTGP